MAPRRRHGKPVSSRRYLVLRHARNLIQARALRAAGETPPPKLAPGYEQLFSSHVPGLRAGKYEIEVTQEIKVEAGWKAKETGPTKQVFDVQAPRFVLPPDCVYSTFPAPGGSAPVETLAHVVLNDTTLPWERGFDTVPGRQTVAEDKVPNRIPWLACLTFEADELLLSEQQLKGNADMKSIFSSTSNFAAGVEQTPTLSVKLDLPDFLRLDQTQVLTPYKTINGESQPKGELIFVKPDLFGRLFTNLGEDGLPVSRQNFCSVSRYQYLAHVRHINTEGMAHAGEDDEATGRQFSIIPSHRTGPPGRARPAMLVSHLVSIEGIEQMAYPTDASKLIALPSLHSWSHACLPAGSFKLADAFESLGQTQGMLRPSNELIPKVDPNAPFSIAGEAAKRLEDGFSMLRWRTIKGDATAAFTRSPFVPKSVTGTTRETLSNSGQALQILDQKLGLMDLSYSVAWQLGRTLALADQSFTAALCRVRKEILQQATDKTRRAVLYATGTSVMEKKHLARRVGDLVAHLAEVPMAIESESLPIDLSRRWRRPPRPDVEVTYHHASVENILDTELRHAAFRIGSSVDPNHAGIRDSDDPHYDPPYDEHNTPASADWMVVLKFVLDLLFLIKVPMHYLVTDASHLPQESLRFFHVDPNWTEALVDGALCLGNQIDRDKDRVRKAMKEAITRYREHVNPDLGYRPPVPTYGFLLRSAVVKEFPDLVVSTQPVANPEHQPLIARQEILDTDLMLVLLTEAPGTTKLEFLTFSQPAHQQCFSVAKSLTHEEIKLAYKRMYTIADQKDPYRQYPFDQPVWKRTGEDEHKRSLHPYIWGTSEDVDDLRILNVEHLAKHVYDTLKDKTSGGKEKEWKPEWFAEISPTAAMLGLQLNEPCWQLKIKLPAVVPNPPLLTTNTNPSRTPASPVHKKAISTQGEGVNHLSHADRLALPRLFVATPSPHFHSIHPAKPLPKSKLPRIKASPPIYAYKVYPISSPGASGVPTSPYAQDLIFSIVYQSSALDWQLQSLTIDIPVGDDDRYCLCDDYKGSGTFMLSNLRMNVLPTYSSAEKVLRLVMRPRSHWGWVDVTCLGEMSFVLGGVEVNRQYEVPEGDEGVDVVCPVRLEYVQQVDETELRIRLVKVK
ncbi:hypothetical protein B0H66DRAFT_522326 [Apodospora peruviana]|uniref:Uncharacterized protein n=1 Tax=Apodospora peruviana TaxID=516989 RepID=A0AAE0HUW2_9PEZI|nr:hypothetical protein B0H66DRAFT_522326 [Apodospora peruviana]